MAIAMCDLILPPNWIIAKTFHFKLLVNLALYNHNLYFVHNTISTPYFHRQKNSTKKNIQQKLFT